MSEKVVAPYGKLSLPSRIINHQNQERKKIGVFGGLDIAVQERNPPREFCLRDELCACIFLFKGQNSVIHSATSSSQGIFKERRERKSPTMAQHPLKNPINLLSSGVWLLQIFVW